jgi:hypothetical protein
MVLCVSGLCQGICGKAKSCGCLMPNCVLYLAPSKYIPLGDRCQASAWDSLRCSCACAGCYCCSGAGAHKKQARAHGLCAGCSGAAMYALGVPKAKGALCANCCGWARPVQVLCTLVCLSQLLRVLCVGWGRRACTFTPCTAGSDPAVGSPNKLSWAVLGCGL